MRVKGWFIQVSLLSTGVLFLCAFTASKPTELSIVDSSKELSTIVPGKRVGPLQLGDTEQRFWQIFQRYDPGSSDNTYPCSGFPLTELHWSDTDDNGIFAYLRNRRIFEVSSATKRFSAKGGLTVGSTPQDVRRNYPKLEAFWLAHIRDLATGDRDFVYWVDQSDGIAFAFYYDQALHSRLVYSIYVFKPECPFVPLGCLSDPHDWRKISPYSLEPPKE